MGTLLKYEFRRSRMVFLSIIGLTLVVELIYLIGWGFHIDVLTRIGTITGIICVALGSMAVLLYGVIMFNDDISKKPGYLLFSTPRSAAQIVGAKLLMTLFAMVGLSILFTLLIGLDIALALGRSGTTLIEIIRLIDAGVTEAGMEEVIFNGYNAVGLCMWILTSIVSFVFNVIVAYVVIVLTRTMMGVQKGRTLLAFVLWIVIINGISMLGGFFSGFYMSNLDENTVILASDSMTIEFVDSMLQMLFHPAMYLPTLILSVVCSVIGYLLTTWMVEKKLSV